MTWDLVAQLDGIFSTWTRMRFANWKGEVHCYTCGDIRHWKYVDAGHFVRRAIQALRFDPDNARPQCGECNRQRDGMNDVFEEELRDELGDERVDEMLAIARTNAPFLQDDTWLSAQIIHYKGLVKGLESRL